MGRPRKLDALTTNVSGRIRREQDEWLRQVAEQRFEGQLSRTLRWAIDQAELLDFLLREDDPVEALDRFLHPLKYELVHPEEVVIEAERELEAWKREQAMKRAQREAKSSA